MIRYMQKENIYNYSDFNFKPEIFEVLAEGNGNFKIEKIAFGDLYELEKIEFNNLNTSETTNMSYMFTGVCALKELDLSSFDTSNVEDMSYMFSSMSALEKLDITSFDTSKVTNMSYMFSYTESLKELDLSNFNTEKVTTMKSMFESSAIEVLNLYSFDTSNVENMDNMFRDSKAIVGCARTLEDANNFNNSSNKPSSLVFGYKNCYEDCYVNFTINSNPHKAGNGMTWHEWAESSYNTIGDKINANINYTAYVEFDGEVLYDEENNAVKPSDLIQEKDYNSLIKFYINAVEYSAIYGMTWDEWMESNYNVLGERVATNGEYIIFDGKKIYDEYNNAIKYSNLIREKEYGHLIEFSINDITQKAVTGMTWQKWIETVYNNMGERFSVNSEYVLFDDLQIYDENNNSIKKTDLIQEKNYNNLIHFQLDGINYTVESGTTWEQFCSLEGSPCVIEDYILADWSSTPWCDPEYSYPEGSYDIMYWYLDVENDDIIKNENYYFTEGRITCSPDSSSGDEGECDPSGWSNCMAECDWEAENGGTPEGNASCYASCGDNPCV